MHVKLSFGSRGITVEAARQCSKDGKEWGALVHMIEFHSVIFACVLCSLESPSRAPVAYHLARDVTL